MTGGRQEALSQVQMECSILLLLGEVARQDQRKTGLEERAPDWQFYCLLQTVHSYKHVWDVACVSGTLRPTGEKAKSPVLRGFPE